MDGLNISITGGLDSVNISALRPGQQEAYHTCLRRIENCDPTTTIVLPTRYGKSDLMRLLAYTAKEQGLVSGSIALSPSTQLRGQLAKVTSLQAMARRYHLDTTRAVRGVREMNDALEYQPFSNNEYLLSATFQLATRNIDQFVSLADYMKHRHHGAPLLVFIDECQETSEEKRRGDFVRRMVNEGALFVLVTATPIRADGELIPGFEQIKHDTADAKRFVVTDMGDGIHNRIDVYEGTKSLVTLKADHTTTFKEAWNENPAPLCHLNREVVDVAITNPLNDESVMLSEIPASQCRRFLGEAVRDFRVIEKAIDLMLAEIKRLKRVNPNCAAIIFTGNDRPADAQDNAHAKTIERVIKNMESQYSLNLDTKIATMKSEDGDDKQALKILNLFAGTDSDNGKGDVLIVKQMGGRGLDVPRVKIVVDLSSVRTVAAVVQRLMRCATPYNGITVGTVITLADQLMGAIWQQQVADEGGEDRGEWHMDDLDLTKTYIKPKRPEPDDDLFRFDDPDLMSYDDSHGFVGNMSLRQAMESFCQAFPVIVASQTKPQIEKNLQAFLGDLNTEKPEPPIDGLTNQVERMHREINDYINELAKPYNPQDREAYSNRLRYYHNRAKRDAGVLIKGLALKHITSVTTLQAMLDAVKTYTQEDYYRDCPK